MDFKNALMLFYIIIISGFFSNFLSCDLIRMFSQSIVIKHILAIISVFYLLTSIDPDAKITIPVALRNTLLIYSLYIISTKSKAKFVVPMLLSLTLDQVIKIYIDTTPNMNEKLKENLSRFRNVLTVVIICLIIIGFIHYFLRAKREFGDNFSFSKFILGTNKCANVMET